MSELMENIFTPKYLQIKNILLKEISGGRYKKGDKIPSENVLPSRFQVSKLTVVKAIEELVNEGILERIKGSGTYVAENKKQTVLSVGAFGDCPWIFELFEEANPDIKISKTIYTHENFYEIVENNNFDLMYLTEFYLDYMVSKNKLLDVTDLFQDILFDKPLIYENVLRLFEHRRKQYAMPFLFSPLMILYNKRLFRDCGVDLPSDNWNWENFLNTALKFKSAEKDGISAFIFAQYRNRWPVYIIQNGGEIIGRDGHCAIGNKEAIEAVKWAHDLLFKHKVCPLYPNMTRELSQFLFREGKAAMILETYYSISQYTKNGRLEIGMTPLPKGKLDTTGLVADAYAIGKNPKNINAAVKFIKFTLSDEVQKRIKKITHGIPSVKEIAETETDIPENISKDDYMKFRAEIPKGRKLISVTDPRRLNPLWHEMDKVWAGMETPETACKNAEKLFNKEH
ncbi:MAG: hypothetical protein A2017_07370 [Lentisphaerae bacterium GWF2_44_16]|nr:MAG: hypothetical protein A2017_07370 [Lentisphaerae bacterium GWF2_44_16]